MDTYSIIKVIFIYFCIYLGRCAIYVQKPIFLFFWKINDDS